MTNFEFIILGLIYMFCYGYALALFVKEENVWLRILLAIVSLVLVLYVPLFIGGAVYEKLKQQNL